MPIIKHLIIVIVAGLLSSCSTTHKIKTSHQAKVDSTAENSITKKGISTTDSLGIHKEDNSYVNDFGIEFDLNNSQGGQDAIQRANDLAGKDSERVYTITLNGNTISSNTPMKSLSLHQAGKTRKIDLQKLAKKDSGQLAQKSEVVLHKDEKVKEKEVERSGANPLIWIPMGIGLLAFIYLLWKFNFFAVFKRKDPVNDIKSKISS